MSIILVIFIISFLIVIHEAGHFFVAKRKKTIVEEFGFGYPPRIVTLFKWKNTTFSLNAIPFGGFVKLEGEEENDDSVIKKGKRLFSKQKPFYALNTFDKFLVIIAGPLSNFIFGVLAFSIVFSVVGIPTSLNDQPRIGGLAPNSPAEISALPLNRNIIGFEIEDSFVKTSTVTEVQEFVGAHLGQEAVVHLSGECKELDCDDQVSEYPIKLRSKEETPSDQGSMGVMFNQYYSKFYSWYEMPIRGVQFGLNQAVDMGLMMLSSLGKIFSDVFLGKGLPKELAGPVGIINYAHQSDLVSQGWLAVLSFAGMLSINLSIMNLLPIPALDGGRILIVFLERFFNNKTLNKIVGYLTYSSFVILLGLFAIVTFKDVWEIIFG